MIRVTLKKMMNVRIVRCSKEQPLLCHSASLDRKSMYLLWEYSILWERRAAEVELKERSQPFIGLMRLAIQQNDWAWRAGESNGGLLVLLIPVGTEHELQLHRINTDCDNVQDLLSQQERQLKSCINREKQHITEILQWLADVYVQNLSHVALYSDHHQQQQQQWSGVCHHFL